MVTLGVSSSTGIISIGMVASAVCFPSVSWSFFKVLNFDYIENERHSKDKKAQSRILQQRINIDFRKKIEIHKIDFIVNWEQEIGKIDNFVISVLTKNFRTMPLSDHQNFLSHHVHRQFHDSEAEYM